jgi:pimeloyl-ACP methyl ester carboxylesterase
MLCCTTIRVHQEVIELDRNSKSASEWVSATGSEPARLAVAVAGKGQAFVWGHALLGSMAQDEDGGVLDWADLADIARVVRFDARGHGRSENAGKPEDYRWDKLARNMWEVADSQTDGEVVLGGASMGCGTALHAACQRPDRVKGLVLVIPPTAWEWREPRKPGYRITANIVHCTRGLPFRLLGLLRIKSNSEDFQRSSLSVMTRHLAKVPAQGVVGAMRGASLSDFPSREKLAALDIPTLILAWPDDRSHPLEVAEELRETMPGAQLVVTDRTTGPYGWPAQVRAFITSLE